MHLELGAGGLGVVRGEEVLSSFLVDSKRTSNSTLDDQMRKARNCKPRELEVQPEEEARGRSSV